MTNVVHVVWRPPYNDRYAQIKKPFGQNISALI